MSECQQDIVSSMTGSTRAGSLKARDEEPLAQPVSPAHGDKRRMTPVPQQPDQPIQLTPLWEHVVRMQQFPPDVDPVSTFAEISMRLRDPEWEVRQHALRVLIDVLPTLNADYVDEIVKPVIAELINNLGHLAPSVRKGALDALRSYLQCSRARDDVVTDILDGLDRRNELFHANINLGVILSTPSLLFPSSKSSDPSKRSVKMVVTALTKRLAEVMYQEAAVRSLVKIRDTIGTEAFDSYFEECSASVRRDFDVLCAAYKLCQKPARVKKTRKSSGKKSQSAREEVENENRVNEGETSVIPLSRVVLETEIKFNQQTAITMTILEQKEASETDSADEEEARKTSEPRDAWIEQRKTPRRVHFGGEIVKLRTPDSEDSETIQAELPQTRIPLPISPVTKMPVFRPGRSRSNPCSPNSPRWRVPRRARSASNSPKREIYVHDGSLSPKKGILSKNSLIVDKYVRETFKTREDDVLGLKESDRSWSFEVFEDVNDAILDKERDLFVEKTRKTKKTKKSARISGRERVKVQVEDSNKLEDSAEVKINEICFKEDAEVKVESENSAANDNKSENIVENVRMEENSVEKTVDESVLMRIVMEDEINKTIQGSNVESGKSLKKSADKTRSSAKKPVFESFPRQERNYIFMELSSPVKRNSESREVSPGSIQSTEHTQEPKAVSSNPLLCELSDQTTLNTELSIDERAPSKDPSTPTTADKLVDEKPKNFTTPKSQENSDEITGSSSDGDGKISEPSWEELGLVDQEVLNDLHNKDDWRARVRGLERIASALRTSSALVAIEPRLGSLLHAVLGCERSCRVAAAGMAVARVLVAGVSEEALRRRLPQIAWGLARQGGPNAAQLARVAMLRLRPAFLLEQLLQPHCIGARNAKTRENALQLLIFSLVTFPSTEFKVENVANKVALMVGDRRRRVRQAALDTLAVLAQIYEPEEVLQAGQRAAKQLREGSEMVAAIRARLARKSLPMVSADGLVVYGLQISPTIQIVTGSDVDWIVAGSGSVSPGTGRARGQIISMNGKMGLEKTTNSKIDGKKNGLERNIVAVGVGLRPKSEKPVAWQLLPPSRKNENNSVGEMKYQKNSSLTSSTQGNKNARQDDRRLFNSFDTLETSCDTDDVSSSLQNDKDVIMKQRKTEENFHRRMDEIYSGTSQRSVRLESRIPVPQYRERSVVRHSTAYQHRQAAEEIYPTPVSAPYVTAGPRAAEIQRRYRGDRVKRPARDSFLPSYRSYTRKNIVQTRVLVAQEPLTACRIDSRALRDATAQNTFSNIQEFNSRVRSSSSSSTLTHNGDKSNYGENDCEEKNRRNASAQTNNAFRVQEVNDQTSLGRDRETYEASSDSSRDDLIVPDFSDDHISPAKSFDVITRDSNPSRRSSIEQVAVNILSTTDSTDLEKETSSDDVASSREIDSDDPLVADQASGSSVMSNDLNSVDDGDRDGITSRTSSAIKAIAFDHVDGSPLNVSLAFDRDSSIEAEADSELRDQASIYPVPKAFFQPPDVRQAQKDEQQQQQTEEEDDEDEEVENSEAMNSVSIVVASRPHSRVASEYREVAFQPLDIRQPPGDGETSASGSVIHHSSPLRSSDHKDISVVDEIVSAPEILHELPIEPEVHADVQQPSSIAADDEIFAEVKIPTVAGVETPKKFPSRVPRSRVNVRGLNKIGPAAGYYEKTVGRSKPITPQCFAQLESNDWEVTVKGLKALSALARQHPEQLDNCPAGIIGRLLGRHVRNLRSQVSRTACIAAGDVFETEARCIDQELDDIAGPLLHRTADTNKFLRADSNAALDRMIEHLPAHRTILVIVQRGASHQNAIVRAATARLLCSIVEEHIGPDLAMNLPRDVREKLLATGAKLLMDGNLDARNYAKTMFRRLSKCEGFRKALTDCVPETTLRHIDKTLRSL